jgi:hypothetical protein
MVGWGDVHPNRERGHLSEGFQGQAPKIEEEEEEEEEVLKL